MMVLAVGSVAAGFLLVSGGRLAEFLVPSVGRLSESEHGALPHSLIPWLTVAISALGGLIAWLLFARREVPAERPERVSWPVRAARKDLYGNALNEALVATPGLWATRFAVFLDNRGVDGAVNGLAAAFGGGSGRLRRMQTGFVRSYAMSMLGGSFLLVAALLLVRFS
jgi:NADH-quinone oxidoreductase subunit L